MGAVLDEIQRRIDRCQADKVRVNADRDAEIARLNAELTKLQQLKTAEVNNPAVEQHVLDLDVIGVLDLTPQQ